jgi:hypothetical protein
MIASRAGTGLRLFAELRDDDAYDVSRITRRRAHGLGVIQPYVLRRH